MWNFSNVNSNVKKFTCDFQIHSWISPNLHVKKLMWNSRENSQVNTRFDSHVDLRLRDLVRVCKGWYILKTKPFKILSLYMWRHIRCAGRPKIRLPRYGLFVGFFNANVEMNNYWICRVNIKRLQSTAQMYVSYHLPCLLSYCMVYIALRCL